MQTDAHLAYPKSSIAVLAPSDNAADIHPSCNLHLAALFPLCAWWRAEGHCFCVEPQAGQIGFCTGFEAGFVPLQKESHARMGKWQLYLALQFWIWVSTQPFSLYMETGPGLDIVTFESTA